MNNPVSMNHNHDKTSNFTSSAREQTRKKTSIKLTLLNLQTWSLTGLGRGMKILCIKDHVCVASVQMIFVKEIERLLTPARPFPAFLWGGGVLFAKIWIPMGDFK